MIGATPWKARVCEGAQICGLPATKACRACKVVKPLSSFSKHRLAKDGHRKDCKVCVKAEKTKRRELTEAHFHLPSAAL